MLDVRRRTLFRPVSHARLGGIPDSGTLRDVRFFVAIALGPCPPATSAWPARTRVVGHPDAAAARLAAAILQQLDLQVEGAARPRWPAASAL
ncbi:hypothetical protein ACTMU2_01945 [Cupriavidus basilensis]